LASRVAKNPPILQTHYQIALRLLPRLPAAPPTAPAVALSAPLDPAAAARPSRRRSPAGAGRLPRRSSRRLLLSPRRRSLPTAMWTLALVVPMASTAFTAQLAVREEYVLLAVFASQLASFCVFTSLLALCALPKDGCIRGRRARWASALAPVGAVLVGLALAVVLACYTELMLTAC
ncbi:hypothetical protein BAE44_0019222, partial [Dichanthelium oligosanthes]